MKEAVEDDYLICPFCGEKDFDKIGLKDHLQLYCEEYDIIEFPYVGHKKEVESE